MPSVSPQQHRFMAAVEHSPTFAKKVGVPQSVGADFMAADNAAGITKHPTMPKAKQSRILRREAIKAGRVHPQSHAEFHAFGSEA